MKGVNVLTALLMSISMSTIAQINKPADSSIREILGGCSGGSAIPDDVYDGTLGTMQCLNITGPGGAVTDVSLDLAVDHTWAGDLTVKVIAPNGTILTVMSRPGLAEPADDGAGCCGDSSDLLGSSPVSFVNGAGVSAEDLGFTLPLSSDVVCQDDGVCSFSPNPGAGAGADFNDFIGLDSSGTWQVCVGDSGNLDTGALCPTTALNITAIAAEADLQIGVTNNVSGSVNQGDSVTFTLNVTNNGPAIANNTVVTAAIPSGLSYVSNNCGATVSGSTLTWLAGSVTNGSSTNCDIVTTVSGFGQISVNASVSADETDNLTANNGSSSSITGPARVIPSLSVYGILAMIALLLGVASYRRKFV